MKWITRERPKIDRIACPWLIRNFIDKQAEFIYVPLSKVKSTAKKLNAIPFDIPDTEYTHYDGFCTFDYFVKKFNINDPAIAVMATIVRGADTDQHELSPQCAGLWAISAGMAHKIKDDQALLEKGMILYDALYEWAAFLQKEKHTQDTEEHLLLQVINKLIVQQPGKPKKIPSWAQELREIIQDKIDTDFSLTLKVLSKSVDVHPAYLSREFSKYFDDLSFGDYMRRLRIEKAMQLMQTHRYTLTQIAYLTGFSDQSHFTRTFRKHTGKNPSAFRKSWRESNTDTKS